MVVLPFFGDQMLVARVVQSKGIGVDLYQGDDSNDYSKNYLNKETAKKAISYIYSFRDQKEIVQANFKKIDLSKDSLF